MTKPYVSPSQLETYARCGEQYRRRYIEREIIPPGVAMLTGSGVHGGIEFNMRQKIESRVDLPVQDTVDAAVANFDLRLAGGYSLSSEEESIGAARVIGVHRDMVADLAELAAEDACPKYQPVLVEQTVRVELPASSHDLLGIIDLADDQRRVIDFKTSGKSKIQSEADGSVALSAYSAFHKAATGHFPSELRLEVLVNTKTPKLQTLVTQRDGNDMQALANRISAITDGIQKGVFAPATPGAWWCGAKWCGFHATCPFVNSRRGSQGD